ncbi:MAG: hypothetical protein KAJ75_04830 [Alphaproteobacteria bacterium]|nr:hypothetical protein [Alphaproteobacteria bacterium]
MANTNAFKGTGGFFDGFTATGLLGSAMDFGTGYFGAKAQAKTANAHAQAAQAQAQAKAQASNSKSALNADVIKYLAVAGVLAVVGVVAFKKG